MKIGILLHPFNETNPAGLGRSVYELTKALILNGSENEYVLWVKNEPTCAPNLPKGNWRIEVLGKGFLWLDRGLRKASRVDIALFTTPIMPLFFHPKKSIVIAHDFAYHRFPSEGISPRLKQKALAWYHGFSLRHADHIVTVSEAAKKEVMKLYSIQGVKITSIHWGFADICSLPEESIDIPEKFLLFVGALKKRKNVFNVVKAFARVHKQNKYFSLIIAGGGGGSYVEEIKRYVEEQELEASIIFTGFVSDGQLSRLYKRALALVFPSFVEGFGFPVLEAMSCGLPVITSASSSLPEIAGDAALAVDPHDVDGIAEAMENVMSDTGLRESLKTKGKERARQFTWKKTAQLYLWTMGEVFRGRT